MMKFRDKPARIAIIASMLGHLVMLLVLWLIKLNFIPEVMEFTEITFVSGENNLFAALPSGNIAPQPASSEDQLEGAATIVQLPERRLLEDEEPQLKVAEKSKQIPGDEVQTLPKIEPSKNHHVLAESLIKIPPPDEKIVATPAEGVTPIEKPWLSTAVATESSGQTPFQIEGQAASRSVVFKVIPEYPEERQEQATVKISFTVLPNGLIGEMIPMIKGDAVLEKITLDALRQWRFNPLPGDAPQRVERGVITFRYLLK